MGLKRFLLLVVSVVILSASSFAQNLPAGVQKVTSIEGITEYTFPNGLRVLLFPDNSKPKITVNVVYLCRLPQRRLRRNRHGAPAGAHGLQDDQLRPRSLQGTHRPAAGGNFNGTTNYDQTMYFETFNASDENLRWALASKPIAW